MEPSRPEWNIPYILRRVFSDEHAANWLLAQEQEPPTSLTLNMMKYSVTADMCTVLEKNESGLYKTSTKQSESSPSQNRKTSKNVTESPSNSVSDHTASANKVGATVNPGNNDNNNSMSPTLSQGNLPYTLSPPETMVWIYHGSSRERAYITMTDSRMPFSFLEPPCEAVPGVRRAVIDKTDRDVMVAIHHRLTNCNSCLMCVRYFFNPRILTQKCAILLGKHPHTRYPNPNDVLESLIAFELPDCQFCLLRGLTQCECSQPFLQRSRPMIPTSQLQDPWSAWSWHFVNYESGLKKDIIYLRNYAKNFGVTSSFLYQVSPSVGHREDEHLAGYRHYLNTVCPLFNSKMLSWALPEMYLPVDYYAQNRAALLTPSHPTDALINKGGRQVMRSPPDDHCQVEELPDDYDTRPIVLPVVPSSAEREAKKRRVDTSDQQSVYLESNAGIAEMFIKQRSSSQSKSDRGKPQGSFVASGSGNLQAPNVNTLNNDPPQRCAAGPSRTRIIPSSIVELPQRTEHAGSSAGSHFVSPSDFGHNAGSQRLSTSTITPGTDQLDRGSVSQLPGIQGQAQFQVQGPAQSQFQIQSQIQTQDADLNDPEHIAAVNAYLEEINALAWNQGDRFSCKLCSMTFSRKYDLKRHVKTSHLPEERNFHCTMCGFRFKRQQHLDSHRVQVHDKPTEYPCEFCEKVLISESNRKRHYKQIHDVILADLEPHAE